MVRDKMRLNQRFLIPNQQNYGLDSARRSFFDRVLDQRLTSDRQQFLGHGLVAGSILVPKPAAGITAFVIFV